MASLDTRQLNETFDLLRNPRRRFVLYYLRNESGFTDLRVLAEQLAEWEWSVREGDLSEESVKSVLTSLRHIHFPKLADAGLITFSPNPGEVQLIETDGLGPFIDEAAHIEYRDRLATSD